MSSSPERTARLEHDLRVAAHVFDDQPIASDAWQQNRRRIAAGRGNRGRTALTAAAALVLFAVLGGLLMTGGFSSGDRTTPAGGGDDPFADNVILGPTVEVESLRLHGVRTSHEAVLSDQTGKGPNLCDRYVSDGSASGGCTARDPNADDPTVVFDWLSGTEGGGDIRGVLAGVDSRVTKVQVWMSNGDATLAVLKPGTWDGTKLFAFTVPADGPRPQRLVAYGDAGRVLQSVDLPERFGRTWLGGSSSCSTTDPGPIDTQDGAPALTVTPTRLGVFADKASTSPDQCLPLDRSVQGFRRAGNELVLVVSPEVLSIELRQGTMTRAGAAPSPLRGVLWRAVIVHAAKPLQDGDIVVALDETGSEVARTGVGTFR